MSVRVRARSFAPWLACVLLLVWARAAQAEPVDEATRTAASTLGYAGIEAFEVRDFAEASEKLEKAYALMKVPSLGLWSARALVEQGRFVKAWQRYAEVIRLSVSAGNATVQGQAQQDAANELAKLGPRLAWVRIHITGAPPEQVSLTIDDAPVTHAKPKVPIAVDPGRRAIEGEHLARTVRTEVVLAEGQHTTAALPFPEIPRAAPASGDGTLRAIGWTAVALGGAGLAAGAAFGISSLVDRDALHDSGCDLERNRCAFEQRELVDAYNSKLVVSGAGLIAGGALAAAGTYLLLFATTGSSESEGAPESPAASARVQLRVAPDSVALHGHF